jgi:hypothetical protein
VTGEARFEAVASQVRAIGALAQQTVVDSLGPIQAQAAKRLKLVL